MNEEQQLKLQAFLDGELPEAEAREVAAWLARDAEAASLMAELRHTREALAGFKPDLKLPESREFYWSKIQRDIERLEPRPEPVESVSLFTLLRRLLVPAGAFAALVIVGLFAARQFNTAGGIRPMEMEVAMTDAGTDALTYRDEAEGTTLVWFSYSAENQFTDAGAGATLLQ
jgi:anti-sigma factor RsiW